MHLVHKHDSKDGRWEVAWMWLPQFLALDVELHRFVDKQMTEKFRGRVVEDEKKLAEEMNRVVVDLIVEKYPIKGLRQLLGSYAQVAPSEVGDAKKQ